MKRKPVPLLKIGIFVLIGFVLLIISVFMLGSKDKMFASTTELKARFINVASLKKGAQIEMAGINVGSVKKIDLPKNARDSVTVTMKIDPDALKLIHSDSKAMIGTEGLIGEKVIVITMGADSTRAVTAGSTLVGEPPKDYTSVIDTMQNTVRHVTALADEAQLLVSSIRTGKGTVGRLLNDDALYRNVNGLTVEAQTTMAQARGAVDKVVIDINNLTGQTNDIIARINRGDGSLGKLLTRDDVYENVKKTTENLTLSSYDLHDALSKIDLGAGRFAEVTEAFKHNFLIKSYFEDRGYWDAPEFEMTIDRKIDSLNRLRNAIESRLPGVKAAK